MKLNVPLAEFKEKWYCAERGEEVYTNGTLKGTIVWEDDVFMVIKLIKG